MEERAKRRDLLLTGGAFLLFFLVASHRLTLSALWFDEAIEYWYSKVLTGPLPFSQTTNMYERIVSTLQPPLYNVLLYFWLKVSDTEWWFRFFGVAAGLVGMGALWRTVKRFTGQTWMGALAVCGASFVYRMVYYWQEAAEYCLMLAALFWTVERWFRLLDEPSRKNILLFTLSAIVPVYSQYGAAFPVAALAVTAFVCTLARSRRATLELCAAYVAAAVAAGLPLYYCFLKKQLYMQRGGAYHAGLSFEGGFLRNNWDNLLTVFRWNMAPDYGGISGRLLLALILLLCVAALVWGRRGSRAYVCANALTWILYYFAVKLGLYADMSYGGFGNRYNLFFIPLWIPLAFILLWEGVRILDEEPVLSKRGIPTLCLGAGICFTLCGCLLSWNTRIAPNWVKDDIRTAVARWYDNDGPSAPTLVYYAANGGFAYYVRMTPGYTAHAEDQVTYMPWYDGRSGAEYREYLNGLYGTDWPDTLYIVSDHSGEDLNTILNEFRADGYDVDELYNYDEGSRLLRLTAPRGESRPETRT